MRRGQARLRTTTTAVVLLAVALGGEARGQVGLLGGSDGAPLAPPTVFTGRPDPFARASREYMALPVGGWLLYPTLFGGGVFDSNPQQRPSGGSSSAGLRIVPSLFAETTDGIHKTTLYGIADGRIFISGQQSPDTVYARAGAIEEYRPLPDLSINLQGDYARQQDVFGTLGVDHTATILNPTAVGFQPVPIPVTYNQLSGIGQIQKNIGRSFVALGGSVVDIIYDHGTMLPAANGVTGTGRMRGGFWLTPVVYAFGEASGDVRRYATGAFDSSGYRVVAGLGSDQIGLFKGEVFAGHQAEFHDFAGLGTTSSPVGGVRLSYLPTPDLTVTATIDESLGVTTLATTPSSPSGTATRLASFIGQVSFAPVPQWGADARAGFIRTDYVGNVRRDDAWLIGGTISYHMLPSLALTLDYQHLQLSSNVPGQGFGRDIVSLGLTYRY